MEGQRGREDHRVIRLEILENEVEKEIQTRRY